MIAAWSMIAAASESTRSSCPGSSTCKPTIRYDGLGPIPSKDQALPFGADVLPLPSSAERVVAIHPNGSELFFTRLAAPGPQIMRSDFRDGAWQAPEQASFSDVGINTEPSISPDGRTLFFVSTRPPSRGTNIWKTELSDSGWSTPSRLSDSVNGPGNEWHPQVVANGDLYFAADDRGDSLGSADLYVSKRKNGAYQDAINLGNRINTSAAEWDAYVDPTERFMLFKSDRAGGYGGTDIYISHREKGGWGKAKNLGPVVNSANDEDSGELTPDQRFVIFARRANNAAPWVLYWIDADALR
jgi:Tol biopolymer transport system component